jgi:micrococcal nuclease
MATVPIVGDDGRVAGGTLRQQAAYGERRTVQRRTRIGMLIGVVALAASMGALRERNASRSVLPAEAVSSEAERAEAVPTAPPSPTPGFTISGWPTPPPGARQARVVRVSDGDTVVLDGIDVGKTATEGRVARLIGVDSPEVFGRTDCFGPEASSFTKRELDGRRVSVDFDADPTDRFRRALVYVWTPDRKFFNGRLAAEGYAKPLTVAPNTRYASFIARAARGAHESGLGLWGAGCRTR